MTLPTRAAGSWSPADVLSSARARGPVARVGKTLPQWLRLQQLRRPQRASVAATGRALRVAWARHAATTPPRRPLFQATAPGQTPGGSRGLGSGLGRETLRPQGQGGGAAARLQACLPRWRRLLCTRPRQRVPQDAAVRAWREHRAPRHPARRHKVACEGVMAWLGERR